MIEQQAVALKRVCEGHCEPDTAAIFLADHLIVGDDHAVMRECGRCRDECGERCCEDVAFHNGIPIG